MLRKESVNAMTDDTRTAIVFGAGKMGRLTIKLLVDYKKVFFCDNDKNKIGMRIDGCIVKSFDELKKMLEDQNTIQVYIAGYVQEIYEQCIQNGVNIAGVYNPQQNRIVSYKEYCISDKSFYCNDSYITYKNNKKIRVKNSIAKFLSGVPMSDCITEVAIELSNLCNYACIHTKCPASQINEKRVMSLCDIKNIIRQLYNINFKGIICFQIYNEPLIDPRLFLIIEYIKQKMPDVKILIYTNGYYLTDTLVKDLQSGFADIIVATGYGEKEYMRLINLRVDIPYYVLWGNLDDRLLWGGEKEEKCNAPCAAFFSQLPIWVNGDVGLCCIDCFQKVVFGNVKNGNLKEVLNSIKVRMYMENLLNGERQKNKLCAVCEWEGIRIK